MCMCVCHVSCIYVCLYMYHMYVSCICVCVCHVVFCVCVYIYTVPPWELEYTVCFKLSVGSFPNPITCFHPYWVTTVYTVSFYCFLKDSFHHTYVCLTIYILDFLLRSLLKLHHSVYIFKVCFFFQQYVSKLHPFSR